jgi:hypothetical protein
MLNIDDMAAYYHPNLCWFEDIGVFLTGRYSILFYYTESSKCIYIKVVSGLIHNYHINKVVIGNNHLVTYLGQGILFSSHSVELWEYWCNIQCNLFYSEERVLCVKAS